MWFNLFQKNDEEDEATAVERKDGIQKAVQKHLDEMGPMSYEEKTLIICFLLLSMLWFFRSPGFMVGWGDYTEQKYETQSNGQLLSIADATAAVLVMILLFVLPKEVNLQNDL